MQDQENNIGMCVPQKSERKRRIHALCVALATLFLLSVAFIIQPSADGIGTHQQLGLPKCGWILVANVPCPTCGMTTAWSHAVRGELPSAFMAQPLGTLLALAAFLVVIGAFVTAITGFSFHPLLYRFPPSRIFIITIVFAFVAWGFKILLHRGVL